MKRMLFDPSVAPEKMDPQFRGVLTSRGHAAARRLMDETFGKMIDVDGNFGKEFATTAFSSRLFELAIFAYLDEFGLLPPDGRPHHAPDFIVGAARQVALEITTSNQAQGSLAIGSKSPPDIADLVPTDRLEARRKLVFQFGKVVTAKLRWRNAAGQRYWELPHTAGLPFVLGYGAFHDSASLSMSGAAIAEYLYGRTDRVDYVDGNLVLSPEVLVEHHHEDKKPIPSGLFKLPDAAHLAGVLFSNEHTASKFLRIALERGYGDGSVLVARVGMEYDLDPNASHPLPFSYRVGERPQSDLETFAEGLHLFINPWCKVAVEAAMFPGVVVHELLDDGRQLTTYPSGTTLYPVWSITSIFQTSG